MNRANLKVVASNAEYEALACAAAEIGRIDSAGPLTEITIPPLEGFDHEGQTRLGFWAMSAAWSDNSFERFRLTAEAIVGTLNRDHGTRIVVNINDAGTQAIVHGAGN